MIELQKRFEYIGGEFIISCTDMDKSLDRIQAYVFDWDGVFNAGTKGEGATSLFAEADSMGTNLLRFGHWLRTGELPFVAIITGQHNQSAFQLAQREHFHAVYFKFHNKTDALSHIRQNFNIEPSQVAFFFDDALDLSAAALCGLRFLIRRPASLLFSEYVKKKNLCDYISANDGANYAVREICELLLAVKGQFTRVLDERVSFGETYSKYLTQRNAIETAFWEKTGDGILEYIP